MRYLQTAVEHYVMILSRKYLTMKTVPFFFILLLAGCSSVTKNMELSTQGAPQTEVVVYRPVAFPAAASGMLLGFNNQYFASLRNNQYIKFKIDSGVHDLQVKANGSQVSNLKLTLKPDEKVCIKSNINPAAIGVALVPLVANMVSWFQLAEVPCPEDKFFSSYTESQKS
jgi:hypothetical protein